MSIYDGDIINLGKSLDKYIVGMF